MSAPACRPGIARWPGPASFPLVRGSARSCAARSCARPGVTRNDAGAGAACRRGRSRRARNTLADASPIGDVGEVSWLVVRQEQHRGRERLGVGEQHRALIGLEAYVGEADVNDDALDLAGQGAGPEPDVITDPEWPGEEQHKAREQVSQ